ncbi:3,4-dihydroxy-2-butanone-4-phosphate synthase [Pseudonocardia xishanensis]|uniref:3,4-dihydroxy-2-butanone-4-phosphate synthase n=1 Tax=Pseudonocardia xishanensis TaxID=630995 RepID=A0ABP8RCF0_9PSEU
MDPNPRNTVDVALTQIAAGRPVVVVDDEDRENEGDLIVAAELVDAATMAFVVRHTSGFVCVALPEAECGRLGLPPMHHTNADGFGTAYRVTVDATEVVSTGISARDRAHTSRLLAGAATEPGDLTRPGHVVPLAARAGGVLERGGHTEAAVDLTRLAGLRPAGVLCEIVSVREPGRMARRDELVEFAVEHDLAMITIADLAEFRRAREGGVERVVATRVPVGAGALQTVGFRGVPDGAEHVAFLGGELGDGHDVPVHVHVECLLGDVFGSRHCGCARRLDAAMRDAISGGGVVVYLRPGRPGLSSLRTLQEREAGVGRLDRDTACAPLDQAGLRTATAILDDLGVHSLRHLHNPPSVRAALEATAPLRPVRAGRSGEVA